jgi:hypothetical protein
LHGQFGTVAKYFVEILDDDFFGHRCCPCFVEVMLRGGTASIFPCMKRAMLAAQVAT